MIAKYKPRITEFVRKLKNFKTLISHLYARGFLKHLRQYDRKSKLLSNKNERKHGQHDAHKHHDTMDCTSLKQEFLNNVKNNCIDLIDDYMKEVNPYSESLGMYQIDKHGNCVEQDLKYNHSFTKYLTIYS